MKNQNSPLRVLCAAALSLAAAHPALAQRTMNFQVAAPNAAGTVTMFVNDILAGGGSLSWSANIVAADTAVTKATKIVNAFNAQNAANNAANNAKPAPNPLKPTTDITLTQTPGTGTIVINNPTVGGGLTGSFNPGKTGELTDRLFIAPGAFNSPTDIPGHMSLNNSPLGGGPTAYSLLDANGNGALFDAGVTVNSVDYLTQLTASQLDPNYATDGGLLSSSIITQDLFNSLSGELTGVAGVSLSLGSDGIDVDITAGPGAAGGNGAAGIIWGTTSTSVDANGIGYVGTLSAVPEPSGLALFALGSTSVFCYRLSARRKTAA